jgi:hypothetical protein
MSHVNELAAAVEEVLVDEHALQERIAELGASITEDYRGRDLLLIGVLKGAIFFMADLMRAIEVPCEVDFMAISSYGAGVDSSGVVRILKDVTCSSLRTSSIRVSRFPTCSATWRHAIPLPWRSAPSSRSPSGARTMSNAATWASRSPTVS